MNNWLSSSEIEIVQPMTPAAVEELASDFMAVIKHLPNYDADYLETAKHFPECLTLVYAKGAPAGFIEIKDNQGWPHLGKDSLEFGGAVIPEFLDAGLTDQVAPLIIRQAFRRTGKKKMLASTHPDNKPARAALVRLGFRPIGKDTNKHLLYRLDRTPQ